MIVDELRSKLVPLHKAGETQKLGVLRYLLSQLKNKEIELRGSEKEFDDEIAFKVVRKEVKNLREAVKTAQDAGRDDLVEKNQAELDVMMEFAAMFSFELNLDGGKPPYAK